MIYYYVNKHSDTVLCEECYTYPPHDGGSMLPPKQFTMIGVTDCSLRFCDNCGDSICDLTIVEEEAC